MWINAESLPRYLRNLFYIGRLEFLVQPEPWRLRIIHTPYPYEGVALFTMFGRPNRRVKPIAEAIRNQESHLFTVCGRGLYLMVYLSAASWEARAVSIMNKLSEFTQRKKLHLALIDRWLESDKIAQLEKLYCNQLMHPLESQDSANDESFLDWR